jgi:ABC-type transport system substrate-binding protein
LPYDPARARRLLAEAGYPNGFDAGDFNPAPPSYTTAEAIGNYLAAIGIRTQMRTMERAAFMTAWREKKLKGLLMVATGASGSAATHIETFVVSTGTYAYGGSSDLDQLFQQQAVARDCSTRQALLHQMQRLMHERVLHAPVFEPATLHGVGPRVEEPAVGLNAQLYFAALYEEMHLRKP